MPPRPACRSAVPAARSETLQEAAAPLVERELAAVHAAAGLSAERAQQALSLQRVLMARLGFERGALLGDLREDEDEDEDEEEELGAAGRAPAAGARAASQPILQAAGCARDACARSL